ncbi:MAG: hypothetical protein LC687_06365 [Actinobacteria bacterium]|nr:hypothetical protein [Actinomycetota bacterium]
MTSNVVMPSKFASRLDGEVIKGLESNGIAIDHSAEINDLDLDDPGNGDIVVGTLTPEEAQVFVCYHHAYVEYDTMMREINSDVLLTAAEHVKQGQFDPHALDRISAERMSEADIKTIARLRRKVDMLRSFLFWHLSERLDAHHYVLGIRSGRRIVRCSR